MQILKKIAPKQDLVAIFFFVRNNIACEDGTKFLVPKKLSTALRNSDTSVGPFSLTCKDSNQKTKLLSAENQSSFLAALCDEAWSLRQCR
jgi:hypothetical protein